MTGDRFAHTVAETEAWLDEVQHAAGFAHERQAYAALRAVLHTARDHLAVADAARFAAQLPTLLRGLFFDGWNPGGAPDAAPETPSRSAFLDTVRDHLAGQPDVAPDHAVQAVLTVVGGRLGQKAVEELGIPRPKDLLHL